MMGEEEKEKVIYKSGGFVLEAVEEIPKPARGGAKNPVYGEIIKKFLDSGEQYGKIEVPKDKKAKSVVSSFRGKGVNVKIRGEKLFLERPQEVKKKKEAE